MRAHFEEADNQRIGHVVAVADVAHIQPLNAPLVLAHGLQIRQHLAGVAEVRQAVDNRDAAHARQRFHFFLRKGANHDAVQIAAQDARSVLHRFAAANLQIAAGQEQRMTPQLVHARLKADARAGRGLLKNHAQRFAFEDVVLHAGFGFRLQAVSEVKQLRDFFLAQVEELQQMLHGNSLHHSSQMSQKYKAAY